MGYKKNEFKDYSSELYRTTSFVELLDKEIYYIDQNRESIGKYKIVSVNFNIYNDSIFISLVCSPLSEFGLFCSLDEDIEISYSDLNKSAFFNITGARKQLYIYRKNRQLSLF